MYSYIYIYIYIYVYNYVLRWYYRIIYHKAKRYWSYTNFRWWHLRRCFFFVSSSLDYHGISPVCKDGFILRWIRHCYLRIAQKIHDKFKTCSPCFDYLKMVEVLTLGTCCFNEDRDLNHRNLGMFQEDSTTKWQFPPPDGCWLGSRYVTQSHTANFLGGFIGSMPNSHGCWMLLAHVAFHEIPTNLVWSLLTSPFSVSEITCWWTSYFYFWDPI